MFYKTAAYAVTVLAVFLICSATATELPSETLQPLASGGRNLTLTQDGPGRWRLIGSLVDSNNRLACGLALASGKCMFTCGPGSPLCEGGTHTLSYGAFDLRGLPTEPDGTIMLQTFVAGNLPGRQVIGRNTARWSAYSNLCCRPSGTVTYTVTIDGVTRRSVNTRCGTPPTFEGWATTSAGPKAVSARLSGCANFSANFTANFSPNLCYRFVANLDGQNPINEWSPVSCPTSLEAGITFSPEETPMAIYPFAPDGEASGLELLQRNSGSPAIE